ncbi:MAG: hypothetical protein ABWY25_09145 [Paenisporosarcina sp.]
MARRLELQAVLVNILGTENVYFQPPPSVQMKYPCIVYHRDSELARYADDKPYSRRKRYQVTVIDRDPDGDIGDKIAELPLCVYDRFYTTDNLNHDVYKLFF